MNTRELDDYLGALSVFRGQVKLGLLPKLSCRTLLDVEDGSILLKYEAWSTFASLVESALKNAITDEEIPSLLSHIDSLSSWLKGKKVSYGR